MPNGIRCTRPLHVDRTAHIPPTSHVTSPRDVTHYSLNMFSLSSYLLQTAVGQCRRSLTDASSAAGPGVRDRLPPWSWNIFYEKHFEISKLFYFFLVFI